MNQPHNLLLQAALQYASHGWRIFPCAPRQKVPLTAHGVKDASTDEQQIRQWWAKWPDANVALACGPASGVYVVDIDVSASGTPNGWQSLEQFARDGHALPETIRQDTPRGGAHFFYRTDSPPANKNSFRPGIDIRSDGYYVILAPSFHPNGGQYAWTAGMAPWERAPAEYPDFMRPATRAPWAAPVAPEAAAAKPPAPTAARADVIERASLYLAECDPAVQGDAGHDKLFWAAGALVHGFKLSDDQTLQLLVKEYNPRCVPPWNLSIPSEARDFTRKITEARRKPPEKPAGWLLEDDSYAPLPTVNTMTPEDVARLIANHEARQRATVVETSSQRDELEFLTQPTGLLGDICAWLNATAIRDQPFLSLACALTFCGALFGRKIRDQMDNRSNLYCMGVAPSSAGKGHAPKQIRRLCDQAGCGDLIGGDSLASDSALEARMAKFPTTLFLFDEIGHFFAHAKSGGSQHLAQVVPTLMKLYSLAGTTYRGKERASTDQVTIAQPCCCVYGTTTPERFTEGISIEEIIDGWLGRCLVFSTTNMPLKRKVNFADVPEHIIQQVAAWANRVIEREERRNIADHSPAWTPPAQAESPALIEVASTPDGEAVLDAFDAETEEHVRRGDQTGALWAKAYENARRIALIVAASEGFDRPVITPSIADYACRLIRYLVADFVATVVPTIGATETEKLKRRILETVERAGIEGCQRQAITRRTQKILLAYRKALLDDLIEAELIVRNSKPGERALFFWTPDNYRQYLVKQGGAPEATP